MKHLCWSAAAALALTAFSAHAAEPVLTLDEAMASALKSNPSLEASEESLSAARGKVDSSWSGFLPQLLVSLGYRRATMNSSAPPYIDTSLLPAGMGSFLGRDEPDSYDNFSAGVTFNHTLWDFGRTTGALGAAKELRSAAETDVKATRESVLLNTVLGYYQVLATQEVVNVAEETVRQMEQHLTVATHQTEAGVRQRIDVVRAESDLASARLNLSKAKNGLQISKLQLLAAMGTHESREFRAERPQSQAATAAPATNDREALVAQALDNRPDLKSLSARARATERAVDISQSGYFPSLGFSAGLNWQGYELKSEAMPMNWFAGLSLNWNALAWIPVSGSSSEAQANARAVMANRKALELGIRTEVEASALALDEARQRLVPSKALVAMAAETLRLAEGRYQAGAGSIVEVTDAQAIYTQARLGQIQAEFDVETSSARLSRALGNLSDKKN